MKHFKLLLVISILFGVLIPIKAQKGNIKGTVLDEYNFPMPGAEVTVGDGEDMISVLTDIDGKFFIAGVASGAQTITVQYLGYSDKYVEVSVEDGNTVIVPTIVVTESTTLSEVEIVSSDGAEAKALSMQRNADNIMNVISTDQVGKFPDSNVGDALKRTSGVAMQFDQGEARTIIVRGLGPNTSNIMINGEKVSSTDYGGGRAAELDLIPADMIQNIELSKSVSADMDGNSTGGSVNLVSRSSTSKHLDVRATMAGGWSFLDYKTLNQNALTLGKRFFDGKLGLLVSGSFEGRNYLSENFEVDWDLDDTDALFLNELDIREYSLRRNRTNFNFATDYDITPQWNIAFKTTYNNRNDFENRYRSVFRSIDSPNEQDELDAQVRSYTKSGTDKGKPDGYRLDTKRVFNNKLYTTYNLNSGGQIDASIAYGDAKKDRERREIVYRETGVPVDVDTSDPSAPVVSIIGELDPADMDLYRLYNNFQYVDASFQTFKFDFRQPFSKNKAFIKAGYKNEIEKHNQEVHDYRKKPTSENILDDSNLTDVPITNYNPSTNYLPNNMELVFPTVDRLFLGSFDLNDETMFETSEYLNVYAGNSFDTKEVLNAGYIMGGYEFNDRLKMRGGVRLENYKGTYQGFIYYEVEDEIQPREPAKTNQTYVLPSFNLKFSINPNTIFRLAYSSTITRPRYSQVTPRVEILDEIGIDPDVNTVQIAIGNPDLKAAESSNFDMTFEKYYTNLGLISGGVFYKSIKDFALRITQNYDEYTVDGITYGEGPEYSVDVSTLLNNPNKAVVYGAELAFQKELSFLPGFLKNLNLFFNYTYTHSDIKLEIENRVENVPLEGAFKHTVNGSLNYEAKKFRLSGSINYTSDYIDEYDGSSNKLDEYYDSQLFLDFTTSYKITKIMTVFLELKNLTNQPLRYYTGFKEYVQQEEYYGPRVKFGFNFNL